MMPLMVAGEFIQVKEEDINGRYSISKNYIY